MSDISKIDRNFEVKTSIEKEDIRFYNIEEAPFKIYGLLRENGKYCRMPEKVAESVSPGVHALYANTAGGRVRFKTDSPYIAIHTNMENVGKMSHFPLTGSIGFDMYLEDKYYRTFTPPFDVDNGYESIVELPATELFDITINFPLYSNVKDVFIGLSDSARVEEASPYEDRAPIVYYGSSITQGGCASRPGRSYQSVVSRRVNRDYINLGFSGNAKAEDEIIEYIKKLDMSLFVYDYDHNAPTVEHLKNTHEKMFRAIRKEHPTLPVIMMSRPKFILTEEEEERLDIIKKTYNNAIIAGDKNVYLLDGRALCELCGNEGTVDGCHPTDFGFASMAKAVGDVIQKYDL